MSEADVAELCQFLSCDDRTARHYLNIFNNDKQRAVSAVLENGYDPDWWGHPKDGVVSAKRGGGKSAKMPSAVEEPCEEPKDHSACFASIPTAKVAMIPEDTSASVDAIMATAVEANDGTICSAADPSMAPTDLNWENDFSYYGHYKDLVDNFIDAVCNGAPKDVLRQLISQADAALERDSGPSSNRVPRARADLVNRLSFRHFAKEGRTPLSYAVAKNLRKAVHDLIDLGAKVSKAMPQDKRGEGGECNGADSGTDAKDSKPGSLTPKTALVLAATNSRRDGTETVRILLSKGANPSELTRAGVNESELNPGMRYWIDKARRLGVPPEDELRHAARLHPLDRLHELDYAVVGEEAAVSAVQEALAGRFGNPQGNRSPLVMLLLGPPGHGKTYFSANAARSLVGEENFLFVPCQSIRDDADLFGSRLGGSRGGEYSSDGQLTGWLRSRQRRNCVVFLDEFEKIKELTSALGWGQDKKIFQSFLEPWQDGTLSDQGALAGSGGGNAPRTSAGGNKIDCSQTIWILTSNWGQREVVDFCEQHKDRLYRKVEDRDVAWLQKNLVAKVLRPLVMRELGAVHEDLKALCRRVDLIVPFLPFTRTERNVVADIALTERFSLYREPCVLAGPEEGRRSLGNLRLRHTRAFARYAAGCYDPMQGASAMLTSVQQADGKFQMMSLKGQLGLTEAQKRRIKSSDAPMDDNDEPTFWFHFDKDTLCVSITQSNPTVEDEDEDENSDEEFETEKETGRPGSAQNDKGGVETPWATSSRNTFENPF